MRIALLDSGIGGLNLLKRLMALYPHNDYVYFADTYAHPYGKLDKEYLIIRLTHIAELLYEQGAEIIVFACNTASTVALEEVKRALPIPVLGVKPVYVPTGESTLIMCTPLTASSETIKEYQKSGALVYANACLAPLVERYIRDLSRIEGYLYEELKKYKNLEKIVLGCTHYIYLKDIIERLSGAKTLDCLDAVTEELSSFNLGSGGGTLKFIFTGPSEEGNYRRILWKE